MDLKFGVQQHISIFKLQKLIKTKLLSLSANFRVRKKQYCSKEPEGRSYQNILSRNFPQSSSKIHRLCLMRFFMKPPIMRCREVVGGRVLLHFFLILLNSLPVPAWFFALFRASKSSTSIFCIVEWFYMYMCVIFF